MWKNKDIPLAFQKQGCFLCLCLRLTTQLYILYFIKTCFYFICCQEDTPEDGSLQYSSIIVQSQKRSHFMVLGLINKWIKWTLNEKMLNQGNLSKTSPMCCIKLHEPLHPHIPVMGTSGWCHYTCISMYIHFPYNGGHTPPCLAHNSPHCYCSWLGTCWRVF